MPKRRYNPRCQPPSFVDRLLSDPFELHVAFWWLASGVMMVISAFTGFVVSRSMEVPPWWISLIMGLFLVAGAIGVGFGLLRDSPDLVKDWRGERIGLALGSVGLIGYSIAVFDSYPGAIMSWMAPLFVASPAIIRIIATFVEEKGRREVYNQWRCQVDEGN